MNINEILKTAYDAADEKKAFNIKVLNISEISSFGDFFIIASGDNINQVHAISANIEEKLGKIGIKPLNIEGYASANWILMDYGDIIIHVFDKESRDYYNIERIWKDSTEVTL